MSLACFKASEKFRVSETAQVLEDACAGLEIRGRILGHRAHRSGSPLQLESSVHRCTAGTKLSFARRAQSLRGARRPAALRGRVRRARSAAVIGCLATAIHFVLLRNAIHIALCKRCKQANSIVSADACKDRPNDAIHKSDLDMKTGISIQMCRYRHGR
jgi:hypothetical protein